MVAADRVYTLKTELMVYVMVSPVRTLRQLVPDTLEAETVIEAEVVQFP